MAHGLGDSERSFNSVKLRLLRSSDSLSPPWFRLKPGTLLGRQSEISQSTVNLSKELFGPYPEARDRTFQELRLGGAVTVEDDIDDQIEDLSLEIVDNRPLEPTEKTSQNQNEELHKMDTKFEAYDDFCRCGYPIPISADRCPNCRRCVDNSH